jgi:hypothetical protein
MNFKFFNFPKIAVTIFIAVIVLTSFHLLNNKFFPVHDFTSGARVYELNNSLKDGHFPPRWSKNFGFGHGMPLFQFYAPLAFYIAQVFHIFSFSIATSLKLTFVTFTIIGFIGAYLLGKTLTNKWGGLITAVAFSLAPYHAVNFYVRGAIAEYAAISFMPFTLYYALKLMQAENTKKNYIGLTISLAALFLSHNITVMTFMPFWVGLLIIFTLINKKIKSLPIIIVSLLNAFLIASFFLLPAFLQKNYTRADTLTEGFSQYQFHFLYFRQLFIPNWKYGGSVLGIEDDMSFYLGNDILAISALAAVLLFLNYLKSKTSHKNHILLYITIAFFFCFSLLLTNFKSSILWDKFPLASFIQFPWRFLGISSLLLSLLAAYFALTSIGKKFTLVSLLIIMVFNARYFHPEKLIAVDKLYNPDDDYVKQYMTSILPDYLPNGINWEKYQPSDKPVEFSLTEGTKINLISNKTQQIIAELETPAANSIIIHRFIFPNWKTKIDDQIVECDHDNFFYRCPVAQGKHTLEFYWSEQGINQLSNILTLMGFCILISVPLIINKSPRPKLSKTKVV